MSPVTKFSCRMLGKPLPDGDPCNGAVLPFQGTQFRFLDALL